MPNLKFGNVVETLGLLIKGGVRVESTSGPRTLSVVAPDASAAQVAFESGSRRWAIGKDTTGETGGNAGADFYIDRYDDSGNFIQTIFEIIRSTGAAIYAGDFSIVRTGANDARMNFDATAGRQAGFSFLSDGLKRWQVQRSADAETGGNVGSYLDVARFDDSGNYINLAVRFYRNINVTSFVDQVNLPTASSGADGLEATNTQWVRDHALWHQEVHFRENSTRTTGVMDAPMGMCVPVASNLTRVLVRFASADASGNTVIQIMKNGSATGMPSLTMTAPATYATWTGSIFVNANEVLTASISSLGTTPGVGMSVVFTGRPTV